MKIYIKNMVCQGTKFFVLLEMEKLGIKYSKFQLGEIDFEDDLTLTEIKRLDNALRKYGLEIMFRKSKLVMKIRNAVHQMIEDDINPKTGFSFFISNTLGYNYDYLNSYFLKEAGLGIEEYFIEKREEKIRETELKWSDEIHQLVRSA